MDKLLYKLHKFLCDYFKHSCVFSKAVVYGKISEHIPFCDLQVKFIDNETDLITLDFGSVICSFLFRWGTSIGYNNQKLIDIVPQEEKVK